MAGMKLAPHFHPVQRLKMSGISCLLLLLHCMDRGNFTFFFTFTTASLIYVIDICRFLHINIIF